MEELQELSSKYIEHIDKNIYLLNHYEKDKEQILEKIVTEKYKSALTTLSFKEEDLVLVRTVGQENFPINLEYYPLDERNCYRYIDNPFKFLLLELKQEKDVYADITIGYNKSKLNIRENELVAYGYRNTKHFSINGLASNIYGPFLHQLRFDNGIAIIIESLKGKIEDPRLVNLNPVDTFFDLENSSMKIDENAIILIQESQIRDFFNKEELKEKLKTHRIYLYQDNPSLAVDLALMYHGYVPQHSKQQCLLDIEYCDYQGRTISDENYLNQWKEFIEKLNQKYLSTTYINVPDSINIRRAMRHRSLIGLPGVLHIANW